MNIFTTRKHGLNPLHSSNQTYPSGKETMTSKFPLPFSLKVRITFNCVESTKVSKQGVHVECKHLPYLHPVPYFDMASISYQNRRIECR